MADMVPLIDRDMYGRLDALRFEIKAAGIGHVSSVFVPVGVAEAELISPAPRVLFVGKATRDWGESLGSFDSSKHRAEEVVNDWLPNGRSAFWQFAREILRQTLQRCEISPSDSELPSFCGWSNLAKIGDLYGNPPPQSVEIQKELCIEALRSEIAFFRPTAVVLVPQTYAQQAILQPIFGNDDTWHFDTADKGRVAYQFHEGLKTLAIWTNHPQGMGPSGTRALVQTFAADLIAGAMKGMALPPGVIQPCP
jgi:hypothetical protein